MLRKWDDLPDFMKCIEVREYYNILVRRKCDLVIKRAFDLVVGFGLLIILAIPMAIIAAMIKLDSEGSVFYRQERITAYGKRFRIHKFRTMVNKADNIGTAITVRGDKRITKVGAKLRDLRLDEIPQIFDILAGNMSFVGARPEVINYVKKYTKEMRATLLLPAGITSEASIRYKNEAELFDAVDDIDKLYIEQILPAKMKYNLNSLRHFSIFGEILIMLKTAVVVIGKGHK